MFIATQEEDEWKDFEEEKKDYTNLKIQNLQISETANADNGEGDDDENEMVENEEGVMVSRKKQPSGPWMRQEQAASHADEPVRGLYIISFHSVPCYFAQNWRCGIYMVYSCNSRGSQVPAPSPYRWWRWWWRWT